MSSDQVARLTYWDGQGNAEIIRLMLVVCGEQWVEQVYGSTDSHMSTLEHMEKICADGVTAMDQVPLLQIDGYNLVQKMAVVRYLARKHGLYGRDAEDAVLIDILSDSVTDLQSAVRDDKQRDRALAKLERALRRNGPAAEYLVGAQRSFVDVQLWKLLDDAQALTDPNCLAPYPLLTKFYAAFKAQPSVAAYLASDRRFPRPGRDGYFDRVKASIPWVFGEPVSPPPLAHDWLFK